MLEEQQFLNSLKRLKSKMGKARIVYFVRRTFLVGAEELKANPMAGAYYVDNSNSLGKERTSCESFESGLGLVKKLIDIKRDSQLRLSHNFPREAFPRIKSAFRGYGKLEYADENGNPISLE